MRRRVGNGKELNTKNNESGTNEFARIGQVGRGGQEEPLLQTNRLVIGRVPRQSCNKKNIMNRKVDNMDSSLCNQTEKSRQTEGREVLLRLVTFKSTSCSSPSKNRLYETHQQRPKGQHIQLVITTRNQSLYILHHLMTIMQMEHKPFLWFTINFNINYWLMPMILIRQLLELMTLKKSIECEA